MGQNKLFKFQQISIFPNVLELPKDMKGKWSEFFKNSQPITLELACGKGEYTTNLATAHPNRNFIGVDIKGNRIYTGAKKALDNNLSNAAFLRTRIDQISDYFEKGEVEEIWIIFPDPFLRDGKAKNRLTHQNFLRRYQEILAPGGIVHLKTDSPELFQFTQETLLELGIEPIHNVADIYSKPLVHEALEIKTYYEGMHLADNRKINYISFQLPEQPIPLAPKKKKVESDA